MGADLYIQVLERKKQYTGFARNLEVGYFRDSYNKSNLLWEFGLSYWADIAKKYCIQDAEEGSIMPVTKAIQLLKDLKALEPTFKQNLQDLLDHKSKVWDYEEDFTTRTRTLKPDPQLTDKDRREWVKDYKKSYVEFKNFLKKAIKLESGIICSV